MSESIGELARRLQSGELTSVELVESRIDAAQRSDSVFISLNADQALRQAAGVDSRRKAGDALLAYAGIPITLKDLFDVRGEVTAAGSRVLAS